MVLLFFFLSNFIYNSKHLHYLQNEYYTYTYMLLTLHYFTYTTQHLSTYYNTVVIGLITSSL